MFLWETTQQVLNKGHHINKSNTEKVREIQPVKTKRGNRVGLDKPFFLLLLLFQRFIRV